MRLGSFQQGSPIRFPVVEARGVAGLVGVANAGVASAATGVAGHAWETQEIERLPIS